MNGRPLDRSDAGLELALRDLAGSVAWPDATLAPQGPDLAARVRARIVAGEPTRTAVTRGSRWRPARRALVLALAALLVLAAVAAAVAFGVPGIRLSFGTPSATPPAVSTAAPGEAPGTNLGLGETVSPDEIGDLAAFPVRLPSDPLVGPPDTAWMGERGEVTFIWGASDALPATIDPDVGLLITEFRGRQAPETISKIIDSGTNVVRERVDGATAYWIDGDPHFSFYVTPEGDTIEETRRWVGDALIWSDGEITYRLETSLGRETAIRIAESMN